MIEPTYRPEKLLNSRVRPEPAVHAKSGSTSLTEINRTVLYLRDETFECPSKNNSFPAVNLGPDTMNPSCVTIASVVARKGIASKAGALPQVRRESGYGEGDFINGSGN